FSFNVTGGRCEACEGAGHVLIEMVFLANVFVPCEVCGGKRFKPEVLEVKVGGSSIHEVLEWTVDQALARFHRQPRLARALWHLQQVGLGYLRLGQPATTLSGGEAQRLKIARELALARRQADLALRTATFRWGTSFVAVKSALADATPFAFITVRFGVAALALVPGTRFRPAPDRGELVGGLLLGALVAVGFISQTAGLVITTPSRSAFIVAVSSILAPLIALALLGQRPSWLVAAALALAMFGIYLLTAPDAGGLNRGDLLTLICAGCFGGQIVTVTVLSRRHDSRRLVFWQIAT